MFKHLLVPLDGSQLAESALPAASYLAVKLDATVTLIHIIEKNPPQEIHGEHHLTNKEDALRYLDAVAKEAFPQGVQVETHVHTTEVSDVARSIVDHVSEFAPDLIVMCSHGQGGLRDIIAGSIAQQVISTGKTPVMLIRPDEAGGVSFVDFQSMLVAMDGRTEHERGLEIVAAMAKKIGAKLNLLTVIETLGTLGGKEAAMGRLLPTATRAMLDIAEESACAHLKTHADDWESMGIEVSSQVLRGEPAALIIETARNAGDDLIVLGTHGKAGIGAFWAGSVAPKVLSNARIPLLLIPVGKE